MHNIILSILIILVGILPNSNIKETINSKLKNDLLITQNHVGFKIDTKLEKVPEKTIDYQNISSGSSAALFVDIDSGEILYEKNKDQKLSAASIAKIMTAIIAVENIDPNKVITVSGFSIQPLDTMMGLSSGDKVKMSEILHGLLIPSGADSASVLAQEIAGNEYKFAALMNEKAKILGLENTQFTNSIGHDESGNYSTASDLVKLGRVALANKLISSIVEKPTYTATGESGKKYLLSNTNKLLGIEGYLGIKTGTTYDAGQCLLIYYNDGSRKIIGVVLGSPERFSDTRSIIEWTNSAFSW